MAQLVLVAGISGSGKTTYARQLESRGFTRLSLDELVWTEVPGGHPSKAVTRSAETRLRGMAGDLLAAGADVALDLPLCQRAQRDDYRRLGAEHRADVHLVWLRAAPAVLHARIAARAGRPGPDAFPVTAAQLDRFIAGFEEPAEDEAADVVWTS